jgi:uncharacterized GH25 family protein
MTGRPVLLSAALLAAAPAAAHDLWIEPSTFHPAVGARVAVRLKVGQNFVGEPLPRYDALVERFVLSSADGDRAIEGQDGDEPAGSIAIPSAGVHVVGYRSNNSYVSQEPQKFENYLREEGLERIVAWRAGRGENQKPSREFFARCAKALLSSGDAPRKGFDRVLGFTLEIVPEKDPKGWQPGRELLFRLLYEGKPLPGALVMALPQRTPEKKLSGRTDQNGHVAFALPHAGVWLVKAVHMIAADGRKADWQSLWASLTFEIVERSLVKGGR